jgi:glucose-6-phosphate isomerase
MTLEVGDLFADWSKNLVTDETMHGLIRLAEAAGMRERIGAMLRGEVVNVTEGRAALHVALGPRRTRRSAWMAATSCPRSTRSSDG